MLARDEQNVAKPLAHEMPRLGQHLVEFEGVTRRIAFSRRKAREWLARVDALVRKIKRRKEADRAPRNISAWSRAIHPPSRSSSASDFGAISPSNRRTSAGFVEVEE